MKMTQKPWISILNSKKGRILVGSRWPTVIVLLTNSSIYGQVSLKQPKYSRAWHYPIWLFFYAGKFLDGLLSWLDILWVRLMSNRFVAGPCFCPISVTIRLRTCHWTWSFCIHSPRLAFSRLALKTFWLCTWVQGLCLHLWAWRTKW